MIIKILSILMILTGAIFLLLSFPPARNILGNVSGRLRQKWLIILYLMGFFVLGYLFFDIILISNLPFPVEIVTGAVFLGGAFFVYIIINLSQKTIAARQKAEEAITLAKDDWESTFDTVTDMITVHDIDYNIIRANPAAKSILGLQFQEGTPSVKCFRYYHGTEAPPSQCASCQSLRAGEPASIEVFEPYLNKHLEIRALPRFGKDRQLVGLIHVVRDITERKRAEEELLASKAQLANALEIAHLGHWEYDVAGDLFTFNDQFYKIFHTTVEEVGGYKMPSADYAHRFVHPDDIEVVGEETRKAIETTDPLFNQQIEHRMLYADGTIGYITVRFFITKDSSGRTVKTYGVNQDITERKRAEEALRESEEKYRELVKNAPAGIYEVDYETNRFISVNDVICEYTGYTRDELSTMNLFNLLTAESQKLMLERLEKLMAGEKLDSTVEYCVRTKDGNELWGLFNARYIYEAGKLKGSTGVVYNITERKRAEGTLRRTNIFLDSIIENIPNMIFLKDAKDLRFTRFNRAGEEMLGYSRDNLLGKNDYDFFPMEQADHFTKNDREVLSGKEIVDIPEESIQTRTKGKRTLHTKKVPLLDTKGEPEFLLGISEDITERKQAGKHLQDTLESLRRALGATIQAIAVTVETRDPYTAGHQRRVADLSRAIAKEMNLSADQIDGIRMAATIHDLGKISVPAEILSKPTKLTNVEFSLIQTHAQSGYDILKDIDFPWPIARIVLEHHERMDGSGYPNSLTGDSLLLESKILAVADVVESMASHRPYRPGLGIEAALEEIEKNKGTSYDKAVVDACLRLFRENGFQLAGT